MVRGDGCGVGFSQWGENLLGECCGLWEGFRWMTFGIERIYYRVGKGDIVKEEEFWWCEGMMRWFVVRGRNLPLPSSSS